MGPHGDRLAMQQVSEETWGTCEAIGWAESCIRVGQRDYYLLCKQSLQKSWPKILVFA